MYGYLESWDVKLHRQFTCLIYIKLSLYKEQPIILQLFATLPQILESYVVKNNIQVHHRHSVFQEPNNIALQYYK